MKSVKSPNKTKTKKKKSLPALSNKYFTHKMKRSRNISDADTNSNQTYKRRRRRRNRYVHRGQEHSAAMTISFGDIVQSYPGMQQIGKSIDHGLTIENLMETKAKFESEGIECDLMNKCIKDPKFRFFNSCCDFDCTKRCESFTSIDI
jgi:hypothetical protein